MANGKSSTFIFNIWPINNFIDSYISKKVGTSLGISNFETTLRLLVEYLLVRTTDNDLGHFVIEELTRYSLTEDDARELFGQCSIWLHRTIKSVINKYIAEENLDFDINITSNGALKIVVYSRKVTVEESFEKVKNDLLIAYENGDWIPPNERRVLGL